MDYLPWKHDRNDDSLACISDESNDIKPINLSYELCRGVSIRRWFPQDVIYDLSADYGIKLTDSIPNFIGIHVVSEKLKSIFEKESDAIFEFYPVNIRNQKGRLIKHPYYLAHLLDILDCMDKKKSDYDMDILIKERTDVIRRLEFNITAIPPLTKIFGLKEQQEQWFVRRDLALKIYREENCRGMIFTKLEDYGREWRFGDDNADDE